VFEASALPRSPEDVAVEVAKWQALGASHLTVNTMGAGLRSVRDHVQALQRFTEIVGGSIGMSWESSGHSSRRQTREAAPPDRPHVLHGPYRHARKCDRSSGCLAARPTVGPGCRCGFPRTLSGRCAWSASCVSWLGAVCLLGFGRSRLRVW
jgi:hypothetical protein